MTISASIYVVIQIAWIAFFLNVFHNQASACSPSTDLCFYNDYFYQYKIDNIESTIPKDKLKVSHQFKESNDTIFRSTKIELENISDEPIYALYERNEDRENTIFFEEKYWRPFLLKKGNEAECHLKYMEGVKTIPIRKLDKQNWICELDVDTCGGRHNPHPVQIRIGKEYAQQGLAKLDRKPPPDKKHEEIQYFLYRGKLEWLKYTWSVELNENYLKNQCEADIVFTKCSGKKECLFYDPNKGPEPKSYVIKFHKPLNIQSKQYKVMVRAANYGYPKENKQLLESSKKVKADIQNQLVELETKSKGELLPLDLVFGRVFNVLRNHNYYTPYARVEYKMTLRH